MATILHYRTVRSFGTTMRHYDTILPYNPIILYHTIRYDSTRNRKHPLSHPLSVDRPAASPSPLRSRPRLLLLLPRSRHTTRRTSSPSPFPPNVSSHPLLTDTHSRARPSSTRRLGNKKRSSGPFLRGRNRSGWLWACWGARSWLYRRVGWEVW
jgi:hypothetical protein